MQIPSPRCVFRSPHMCSCHARPSVMRSHTPQGCGWDDEHGCFSTGSLFIIIRLKLSRRKRHRLGTFTLAWESLRVLASTNALKYISFCPDSVLPETALEIFPDSYSVVLTPKSLKSIWHNLLWGSGSDLPAWWLQAAARFRENILLPSPYTRV